MNYEQTEKTLEYLANILTRIQVKQAEYKASVALLQINGFGDYGPEVDKLHTDIEKLEKTFDTVKRYL
ncbi:hypothetical protein KAR91_80865 [Candidatus Pacearchaeota archaeon]|nr:hypothetical protein [Candidatus Pacearchaeota archaeon]